MLCACFKLTKEHWQYKYIWVEILMVDLLIFFRNFERLWTSVSSLVLQVSCGPQRCPQSTHWPQPDPQVIFLSYLTDLVTVMMFLSLLFLVTFVRFREIWSQLHLRPWSVQLHLRPWSVRLWQLLSHPNLTLLKNLSLKICPQLRRTVSARSWTILVPTSSPPQAPTPLGLRVTFWIHPMLRNVHTLLGSLGIVPTIQWTHCSLVTACLPVPVSYYFGPVFWEV